MFENFDYTIPAMPTLEVDIPLKREMYPFQKEGVAYNLQHKRVIVGDQPGLGKTAQAIATIVAAKAFPCLIVCPASLKLNWQIEIGMWTNYQAMILNPTIKRTWPYFHEAGLAHFFIVNYESLKSFFVTDFPKKGKKNPKLKDIKFSSNINIFKSIIIDEAHRTKDTSTIQAKLTKGLSIGKEYILALTGTPVVNHEEDLISILGITEQIHHFGGYSGYKNTFVGNSEHWDKLNVLLRRNCFYRREKADVLTDLPAKVRQSVYCDITTRKEYNDALADLEDYLKVYRQATDEQVQKAMRGEIMVRIGILKNISARGKITSVIEYVSDIVDSGEKIILFVHLREVADQLKRMFPSAATILGNDDMATRQHNVERFQKDPRVQVIICSIKAAGVGITLTASSRVAFVELPWHPADCEQCEDRAHRIGQKDSVHCTYFLGKNTIDEWIYRLIDEKRSITRQITGAQDEVETSIINGIIELLNMIDTGKIKNMLKKSEKLAEIYGCKLNLGFSGGKDSVVLKYFADYHGIDYVANFNNTQIEQYKGMINFIKTNYPGVNIIHPDRENSFFELMKKKGIPSMFRRWCCESLKHSNPKLKDYRVNIMGIRGEESINRLKRGEISVFGKSKRSAKTLEKLKNTFAKTDSNVQCEGGNDKVNIYPIFDLTERYVFEIIKTENLVIPDVYRSSTHRLGCAFCPFASFGENLITIKDNPNLAKMWLKTMNEDFMKKSQKNVLGKTNSAGLFYLYIKKHLLTNELFTAGLQYLLEKDLSGKTGLQVFEKYLNENVYERTCSM